MRFPSLLQPLLGDFIEQLGLRKSEGTDEDDWQFLEFEVKLNQVTLNSALDGPINKLNAQEGIRDELKYFREKVMSITFRSP